MLADALSILAAAALFGSVAALYLQGVGARRRRGLRRPSRRSVGATICGLAIAALAVSGPADSLADQLFWVHMIQHLVLVSLAAPLIVLGDPFLTIDEISPDAWRRAGGRASGSLWGSTARARRTAVVAWVAWTVVLLGWHAPLAFDAALRANRLHALEHLTLLVSAVGFWWPILLPGPRARIGPPAAIAGVVGASMIMAMLGAALVFSPTIWYPSYRTAELARGISPLTDQQLAGSIMWVPAGLLYLGVAAWLFVSWVDDAEPPARGSATKCPRPPTRVGGRGRRAVG